MVGRLMVWKLMLRKLMLIVSLAVSSFCFGQAPSYSPGKIPINSTVGQTGVWATLGGVPFGLIAGTNTTPSNNVMYFAQMNLSGPQVIGHFSTYVTTGGTAETLWVCLYNGAGTTLLWSANATVNAIGAASGSATQYTAQQGTYLVGYEETGTTTALLEAVTDSSAMAGILNANGSRLGTAGNVITGTPSCPTTLGTLTKTNSLLAAIAFEP